MEKQQQKKTISQKGKDTNEHTRAHEVKQLETDFQMRTTAPKEAPEASVRSLIEHSPLVILQQLLSEGPAGFALQGGSPKRRRVSLGGGEGGLRDPSVALFFWNVFLAGFGCLGCLGGLSGPPR